MARMKIIKTEWPPNFTVLVENETYTIGQIQDAVTERDQAPALGGPIQGETKGVHRARVRFTGLRVRPLDPDNFAGSCKDLLDGLRHAGLILGDEPWRIIYETTQTKVDHYAQEATLIEIET